MPFEGSVTNGKPWPSWLEIPDVSLVVCIRLVHIIFLCSAHTRVEHLKCVHLVDGFFENMACARLQNGLAATPVLTGKCRINVNFLEKRRTSESVLCPSIAGVHAACGCFLVRETRYIWRGRKLTLRTYVQPRTYSKIPLICDHAYSSMPVFVSSTVVHRAHLSPGAQLRNVFGYRV